jgi:preprotein translocase subunit SecY
LIQRHYDGFLRKGRIRGRNDRGAYNRGEAAPQSTLMWLYVGIAVLVIAGVAIVIYQR